MRTLEEALDNRYEEMGIKFNNESRKTILSWMKKEKLLLYAEGMCIFYFSSHRLIEVSPIKPEEEKIKI